MVESTTCRPCTFGSMPVHHLVYLSVIKCSIIYWLSPCTIYSRFVCIKSSIKEKIVKVEVMDKFVIKETGFKINCFIGFLPA